MATKKNPHAVALAELRNQALTPERRQEIAARGGEGRAIVLTPEERSAIAKMGAQARWGKPKKKVKAKAAKKTAGARKKVTK